MKGECRNCSVPILWGVLCGECVRMFLVGIASGLATWLLRWLP